MFALDKNAKKTFVLQFVLGSHDWAIITLVINISPESSIKYTATQTFSFSGKQKKKVKFNYFVLMVKL